MKTFEFCIVASGLDPDAKDFADRFFEAGCSDATISFQKGHIILDFNRDAESIAAAIASAVEDATKAGATVNRIEPDPLVSLSDIAARTGLTRAAISHYHKGDRGDDFPPPIARVTSSTPLWDWASVAKWMYKNDKIEKEAAVEAELVKTANGFIGAGDLHFSGQLSRHAEEYDKELEAA